MAREVWTAEQMKEMLGAMSEKIPALLNNLTDVLYGKGAAEKYAQAVSGFYKTLKDSGMSDEQAFRLTEQYMSSLSLGQVIGNAFAGRHHRDRETEDEKD